jgi:three-Cys-motif partner protein
MSTRKGELRDKTIWPSDPHTLVKHLVYRHYLECWMPKILQRFPQATIVDAFAGPGVYEDGLDGSPILAAKTFLSHTAHARFGELTLVCLEKEPARVQSLHERFAALGATPKLTVKVLDPGEFIDQQASLSKVAHGDDPGRPVLWLLDPFNIRNLPFDKVRACLSGPRDEAFITFFAEEMHRFCTREGFNKALDAHFGSASWISARRFTGEAARKEALVSAYEQSLAAEQLLTGHFSVRVRNATARYYLVFATHSEYGLKCWNPVKWKLDSYAGHGASAASLMQLDLFDSSDILELKERFGRHAGEERTWSALLSEATTAGYLDKHVREALDELAAEGLAFRVHPTEARTAWPDGCRVRFYRPQDAEGEVVEPLDV